ncbi:MAG: DUF115 domain-containing protein [Proteobacteria bacterium]|nr:DUF115 domain-containing protein [Pseudomonadota bacterium]
MTKEKEKKNGNKYSNHLIKKIADIDWTSFKQLMSWHNKNFTDQKMTFRKFFKLMNTYSPIVQSLFQLDPNDSPIQRLGVNTALCHAKTWTRNIGNNITRIKAEHDIRKFKGKFSDKAAIIIGAGESLKDNASGTDHLQVIKEYADRFNGIIIVVDRVLEDCLKLGIGDYFTVVDGSEIIYDKFFDNDTVRNYINTKMSGIMVTCANEKVVNAWKGQIYFFVASIPAEILPNATPLMCDFSGGTSDLNAGGNAGALAWNIAVWMGIKEVALVGMDYSYKVTTPYEETSNWHQYKAILGEEEAKKQAYKDGYNKFFKTPYRIDDIYQAFKDVAHIWFKAYEGHGHHTYNCTEGGALEGEGITQMYLKDFLKSHLKK